MKTKHFLPSTLVLLVVLLAGCSRKEQSEPAAAPEKSAESASSVKRATNGNAVVTLDAATQKLMGLHTADLAATQISPELKGYGRVLDISPLVSLVADLAVARAAADASQAELRRLKTLAAQNNASERSLQTAEAAAVHDQAQLESARLRLVADWGGAIAAREDLPDFVKSLGTLDSALVRIDLPAGQSLNEMPTGARLVPLDAGAAPVEAKFIGPAPTVDPQFQGRGFLFLVSPNPSRLAPGSAVSAYLPLPGEPQSGVTVPREAVIRFNGATWVYVQTGDQTFERREAALEIPQDNGWFVREGFKLGDKVVTAGAQQMLSEELKGLGTD
jgi:multidrug efflux pump subunit AcrA (membrane-fusion protein)